MPPDRGRWTVLRSAACEPTSFKAGDSHLIAANHVHERSCQRSVCNCCDVDLVLSSTVRLLLTTT